MGHCSTWFAVAASYSDALTMRLWPLACGDWSQFSAAEQSAFAFAKKQVENPSSITEDDLQSLLGHFGTKHALGIILSVAYCLFKVWVSDVFQLDPRDVPFLVGPLPEGKLSERLQAR
jgi:hypothetical protein